MIQEVYYLEPSRFEFHTQKYFPKQQTNKKVAVLFSGGMESTLVARLCFEIYGKDKTDLIYTDDMFSMATPLVSKKIHQNVSVGAQTLGKTARYCQIDYNELINNTGNTYQTLIDQYSTEYEFFFAGFTKLFFDLEPLLTRDELLTNELIEKLCYNDFNFFSDIINEFHLPTSKFTHWIKEIHISKESYRWFHREIAGQNRLKLPIINIQKYHVVDLYRQLGWMELLYKTRSCVDRVVVDKNLHCGKCFNCQQRHDGFVLVGESDPTAYSSDTIVNNRKLLSEGY
jgi:7-cyano-7-deazaguanine synthase in queuosine biosynthesis